jgi:hypothetical protein
LLMSMPAHAIDCRAAQWRPIAPQRLKTMSHLPTALSLRGTGLDYGGRTRCVNGFQQMPFPFNL